MEIRTFFDKFKEIIDNCQKVNQSISEFNNIYKQNVKEQIIIELHEKAISLLSEKNNIEFMGIEYSKAEIEKYLKEIKNEKNKILSFIKIKNDYIKNQIEILLSNNNINEYIKNNGISEIFLEIKLTYSQTINEDENIKFNFNIKKIEEIYNNKKIDNINQLENILTNFVKEHKFIFTIKNYSKESLKFIKENIKKYIICINSIKDLKKQKNNEEIKIKEEFLNILNNILFQITNEEIKIKLNSKTRTDENMIEIFSEDIDILQLSEGEKCSLALSYFLTDLFLNFGKEERNFIIFIDDPFDSNDHFKYDNLPKLKINDKTVMDLIVDFCKKNKEIKGYYILSTHNVNVLSAFIRNQKSINDENSFFIPIKNDNIQLLNLIKKKKTKQAELLDLDISLFFPREEKIRKFLLKNININELDLNNDIELLISLLLLKLLDLNYGNYKDDRGKIRTKITKLWEDKKIINFESINYIDIKNYILKKTNDLENEKINLDQLIKYLLFIKNRYMKIWNSFDEESFKRLRHKNNIYSSPIGHIIEE
ncbi:MAG: hypothetical protein ACRCRP_02560 [Metamycoplasmataceae bacterium]